TASDGTLSSSQSFAWFISNGVITVSPPDDQTNAEGDSVALTVSASSTSSAPLSFSASGLPAGLGISSTGVISGTISTGAATTSGGQYTVVVSASDAQGNISSTEF